ncbi:MAG: global cell cycle regulator GcrA-like protein [Alphaproteobacteria bacterium]|nr:global cell cycle regulator GcrA-like protein [Alphaproteobacteria bacterium]
MAWTDEQVDRLQELWAQGLTANEIAKILGVTKNSIVGKVHRLCLPARPSPIKSKENEGAAEAPAIIDSPTEASPQIPVEPKPSAPKPTATAPKGENIRLIDLDSHTCRWPIGDPRDEDFCFCGRKVRTGQTYCDEHSQMAYVKATKK